MLCLYRTPLRAQHERGDDLLLDGLLRVDRVPARNYGAEKVRRTEDWLRESGLDRGELLITAYTDHASDAPILDFADQGVLVGRFAKLSARWQQVDWGR